MEKLLFYFLLCLISQTACQSSADETARPIVTVTGEAPSSEIDTTISHDADYYDPDEPNGGGYQRIHRHFEHLIPALRDEGFSEDDIEQLLVQNPQNAYGKNIRTN